MSYIQAMTPLSVLKKYWSYDQFRQGQAEIIDAVLTGRDVLALLPTGGGKSICYQVPAMLLPGLTLVISPLISLMQDQVQNLTSRGIEATYLASSLDRQEVHDRLLNLQRSHYKLAYLSPERLKQDNIQALLKTVPISLVVIDEAHCVSQWGHSFRPPYRAIAQRVKLLRPEVPIMALTATATRQTVQDLITTLRLKDPHIERLSFYRDIAVHIWKAKHTLHKDLQLLSILKQLPNQPSIIYASTRENVELVAAWLKQLAIFLPFNGIGTYHAGMRVSDREAEQQAFLANQTQLMVATSAFGMGIDKPDITTVIHYQLPGSLEQYYQEIGRAGRGGQHSTAHLFLAPNDLKIQTSMASNSDTVQTKRNLSKLTALLNFTAHPACRMQCMCAYFGEQLTASCKHCDRCLPGQQKTDSTIFQRAQQLSDWRLLMARQHRQSYQTILTDTQLQLLSLLQPRTERELKILPNFGKLWIDEWGKKLLSQPWYNTTLSKSTARTT